MTSTGTFGRTADVSAGTIEKTSVVLVKSSLTWFIAEHDTSANLTSATAETFVETVPVLAGT